MKLIELPKSPYWGANLHVGYYPDGKKRYSPRSSKVVRDPSRVNERGQREDKAEALAILTALQNVAMAVPHQPGESLLRLFAMPFGSIRADRRTRDLTRHLDSALERRPEVHADDEP